MSKRNNELHALKLLGLIIGGLIFITLFCLIMNALFGNDPPPEDSTWIWLMMAS
jgi:hypothetical protein